MVSSRANCSGILESWSSAAKMLILARIPKRLSVRWEFSSLWIATCRDTSCISEGKFAGRVPTYSQDVRSAQQVPLPFSRVSSSSRPFPSRFLWAPHRSWSLSLSLSFSGSLRSLAICKPASSTGIEDVRACYVPVHALPRIYAGHAYMHGT